MNSLSSIDKSAKRLRILLYTKPLLDLQDRANLCDESLQHYDPLALTMKLFDAIIKTMVIDSPKGTLLFKTLREREREIESDMVIQLLSPLMTAMDREQQIAPDSLRHGLMVEWLLSKLLNDSDGRKPFRVEYTEFDGERSIKRILEFRLVNEVFNLEGRIVLRLSDEAMNLWMY
jgi:hypothetical protein